MENEGKTGNYIIGFDQGTNSLGYAVIDRNCKVIRKSGKRMWGSILFDEGRPAAKTRVQRSARRRYERRKERIRLLRMLTEKSVLSVDPSFFKRLDDSFLLNVRKDAEFGRDNLFNLFDGDYTDRDYYREYKTIYHLRKRLCEDPSRADIRLVYLALHHIVKYRGNFLHDEENMRTEGNDTAGAIEDFFAAYQAIYCDDDGVVSSFGNDIDYGEFAAVLKTKAKRREKKDKLISLFSTGSFKKQSDAFVSLLLGMKVGLTDLFPLQNQGEVPEDVVKETKVSFEDGDYDEKAVRFPEIFGDDIFALIEKLHRIYLDLVLSQILGEGKKYIYEGMIDRFEKNKKDLAQLKSVLRADKAEYDRFFKEASEKNFVNYFRTHVRGGTKPICKGASREDFYSEVRRSLAKFPDSPEKTYCLDRMEEDDFLIRLNSTRNAAIPYQLNLNELKRILDRQSVYYPELKENYEKIVSLLTFRRPYSVGIISPASRFSWVEEGDVKKERAYPWNFDEVVDYDAASEKFIRRMTNRCAIFKEEEVLPSSSVSYQIFNVLNELANARLLLPNGKRPLTVDEKQAAFRLFLWEKATVTAKDVTNLLYAKFKVSSVGMEGLSDKTGKKFASKMNGYRAVRNVLQADCFGSDGEKIVTNYALFELYEKIIEILTVFTDRAIRKRALKKILPSDFDEKTIEKLLSVRLAGWGRYSAKCLCRTGGANGLNVLETMYTTDRNFRQVETDENLGFKDAFSGKTEQTKNDIAYADVNDLYLSPAVKRTVWQTVKAVKEIVKIMGEEPRCIFLESTRTDEAKNQTRKRSDIISGLYNRIRDDVGQYNEDLKNAEQNLKKSDEAKLNDEKVYLYFLQMGKCMYSGEKLNFEDLSSYEVDHIVPRCYIKDDSIQNKALVLKKYNQEKSGTLALQKSIRDKMTPFWSFLKDHGMIGKKKFDNLTKAEYTDGDLNGFIARQLTETNQSIKGARELLKSRYADTDVEFVKAGISSVFRMARAEEGYTEFLKSRNLNDFHHAKDAYLAAVIGYFTRKIYPIWGANSEARILKDEIKSCRNGAKTRELCQQRNGIVVDAMKYVTPDRDDGVEWNVCYNNILSAFSNNDCLVTRKKEEAPESAFYNATIRSPKAKTGNIPLRYVTDRNGRKRPLPPELYGNYEGENAAYFVFATFEKGKKRTTVLTGIPVRIDYLARKDDGAIGSYLSEIAAADKKKLISYEKKKILKYQLIRLNGQLCYVTSSSEVINAEQLVTDNKYSLLLYCLEHPQKRVAVRTDRSQEESRTYCLKEDGDYFAPLIDAFIEDYVEKLERRYANYKKYAEGIRAYASSPEFSGLPVYSSDPKVVSKHGYLACLLNLTKACSTVLDMQKYGGKKGWGRLKGKTIYKEDIDLIDTSITGVYRCERKGGNKG